MSTLPPMAKAGPRTSDRHKSETPAQPGDGASLRDPGEAFRLDADLVLTSVRRAFGRLVESLPGPIRSAGDVQRALDIDKALGWQIFRVSSLADPIAAGPDVPRPDPLNKALRAAAGVGVKPDVIADVKAACVALERLIVEHAGDRRSFEAMVRALRTDDSQIPLKERRAAFRSLGSVWGICADVHYYALIVHPSDKDGRENAITLSGHYGLRKLRPGSRFQVGARARSGQTTTITPAERMKLDILEEFSTAPLPAMTIRELEGETLEATLDIGAVGRAGAINYIVRNTINDTIKNEMWGTIAISRLPAETAVLDVLVPVGWSDPSTATAHTYGNLHQINRAWELNPADMLPVSETIHHLGTRLDLLQTRHVPRCPEMIHSVLAHAGWQNSAFDIYRTIVQYPILFAAVAPRVNAHAKP